jgi:fluoride exporter
MNFLLVFIGGGLGSVMRYGIGLGLQKASSNLPLATFLSNITACVLFALALYYMQSKDANTGAWRSFLLTGICGGLSTFSTFGWETYLLFSKQDYLIAVANIVLSITACILIFFYFKNPLVN